MQYNYSRFLIIALITIPALTGCGSGGESEDSNGIVEDGFTIQDIPEEAFVSAYTASESLLQFGYLGRSILAANLAQINVQEQNCSKGGTFSLAHSDNDADDTLSDGDVLKVTYNQCFVDAMDGYADGELILSVESRVNNMEQIAGTIDASAVAISGDPDANMTGLLRFQLSNSPEENTVTVNTVGKITINMDGSLFMSIIDLRASRIENLRYANYTMSSSGTVDVPVFGGRFSFEQVTPWSGYLLEYPHQGEMRLFTSANDTVTAKSNFDVDSELVDLSSAYADLSSPWNDYSEGLLWGYNNKYFESAISYSTDNFRYLGVLNEAELSDFPVNGTVTMLFSRPVAEIIRPDKDNPFLTLYNRTSVYDGTSADIRHRGALLKIVPVHTLIAGNTYYLSDFRVASSSGALVYDPDFTLKASERVIHKMKASSYFYREGDTPLLDASSSFLNRGEHIKFQWVDILSKGIVFDNPQAALTEFIAPETRAGYLAIGLEVSNEFGDIAKKSIILNHIENVPTFFAYAIGDEYSNAVTSQSVDFKTVSDDSGAGSIQIYTDISSSWSFRIAPPLNETLMVKKYLNTQTFGGENSAYPSLRFSATGRSDCSTGDGEFEIFELERDVNGTLTKLAVDFHQNCEDNKPPLQGIVRFNSTYKINAI